MSDRGFVVENIDVNRSGTMQDYIIEEGKKIADGKKYEKCIVTVEMTSTGNVENLSDKELLQRISNRLKGVI